MIIAFLSVVFILFGPVIITNAHNLINRFISSLHISDAENQANLAAEKAREAQRVSEEESNAAELIIATTRSEVDKAEQAKEQAYIASTIANENFIMKIMEKRLGVFDYSIEQGYEISEYPENEYYAGDYVDEMRTGYGIVRYDSGTTISGQWCENLIHGYALAIFQNGEYYAGQFKDGNYTGHAVISCKDGSSYAGQVKDFKWDGMGKFDNRSNDVNPYIYWGQFNNNRKEGYGVYEFERCMYIGRYNSGQFVGIIKFSYIDEAKCKELYQQANYWLYSRTDISYYAGEWTGWEYNGYGVMEYANNDYYAGQFINNLPDGYGILYDEKDTVIACGVWKNGEYKGK